jgi:hypothetical protein
MIRARRFKIWGLNPPVCYDAIIGGETSIPLIDMPECARPNVSSRTLLQYSSPSRVFQRWQLDRLNQDLICEAHIGFLRGFSPRLPSSTIVFCRSQSEQASAVSLHLCFWL